MDMKYDVIVIGAGPGGSACAALLARRGLHVLLLDKNPRAGGRMTLIEKDGFTYESFPINGVPARGSRFEPIIAELGLESEVELIRPVPAGVMSFGLPSGEVKRMVLPSNVSSALRLLKFLEIKPSRLLSSFRLMKDMMTAKDSVLESLDDVTLDDFLRRYDPPETLYAFLGTLAEGALETPVDLASAGEFIRLYQQSALHGSSRYVAGGYGHMFEAFAASVARNGGTVLMSTPVGRILIEDGAVAGVVASGPAVSGNNVEAGEQVFRAPIVVSNASIQTTVLKLVGEEHFDKGYLNYVKDLHAGWAYAGYRAILGKPILEHYTNIYFSHKTVITSAQWAEARLGQIPEEAYIFVGTNSIYPGMAPAGKQLVYMGMTCPADPGTDIAPYLARVRAIVERVWPDIFPNVESLESYGPASVPAFGSAQVLPGQGGEVYGLAQIVGQCGRHKPKAAAPVRGLYYVGFSTGQGLGTHAAADSAVSVADQVLLYHKIHRERQR
ncbi:MAG TPA: NAD(P)/FAD-dependent oxidoreductase [Rectinemataceae bacterium]|nr:NAD(P)/FAD-dependent oxidoreductase [Rectinemataceae bacterium]